VERAGRDVCVIVDVSKSMLADDLAPTRLGRTKVWLNDLIDGMSGDRLAVIAMAGRPALVSPLTHDYAFARFVIEQLDPTAAGKGGTNLGDAVRLAVDEAFPDDEAVGDDAEGVQRARFRTVLLISDGGDTVDSLPVEAARAAGERGIRLVTIGIGSEAGATVPDVDPFGRPSGVVRDARGRAVVSKLDSATLRAMAEATPGGVYLDVGTRDIDLAEVYAGLMQQAAAREMEWAQGVVYEEWYGVFALGALVCLFLSEVINERRRP
jgi:Ca-activated chloride channel family protein